MGIDTLAFDGWGQPCSGMCPLSRAWLQNFRSVVRCSTSSVFDLPIAKLLDCPWNNFLIEVPSFELCHWTSLLRIQSTSHVPLINFNSLQFLQVIKSAGPKHITQFHQRLALHKGLLFRITRDLATLHPCLLRLTITLEGYNSCNRPFRHMKFADTRIIFES